MIFLTVMIFKELFEDMGALRVARVHYDENGQSLGTAEVVFERRADAVNAQQKYNGLNLDGKIFLVRFSLNDLLVRPCHGYSTSRRW